MEIEYSNEVKGLKYAYRLETWEKQTIAKTLLPLVKKMHKQIEAIDNDPENEGQVTFSEKKREIRNEIRGLDEIIKEFS